MSAPKPPPGDWADRAECKGMDPDGLRRCARCGVERKSSEFYWRDKHRGTLRKECKQCTAAEHAAYYRKNGRRVADRVRLKKYNLTAERYDRILAAQGGVCGVCGSDNEGSTFHVDHDHRCCPGITSCGDCVRGVLCNRCSVGLGSLGDQIDRVEEALAYLRRYERRKGRVA